MNIDASPNPSVIRAAGGLVWWLTERGPRLALVHRPKYDDWSLPKGKLEPGESWLEAAVREVAEETGCEVRVAGFAGTISYLVKGRAKTVLFWNMERVGDCNFTPAQEVDQLLWLSRGKALELLHHPAERTLLNGARF
ncbi:MAG: NUDIX hydrolase [bacterium]|nr:NUDIX hydrolase [bacterium]